jgi:hypothetical protein
MAPLLAIFRDTGFLLGQRTSDIQAKLQQADRITS